MDMSGEIDVDVDGKSVSGKRGVKDNPKWSRLFPHVDRHVSSTRSMSCEAAPSPRSLHVAVAHEMSFYVFGGYNGSERVNDLYQFCVPKGQWELLDSGTDGAPSPRDRHSGCVHGGVLYIWGGFDGDKRVNDMWAYDLSKGGWRRVLLPPDGTENRPSPRHSHSAVVVGNTMYVGFGYDGDYNNDFYAYDFDTGLWRAIAASGTMPCPRYRATLVSLGGSDIVLFGGHNGVEHLNDVFAYSIETQAWRMLSTAGTPPSPRDSHAAVACENSNSMYIFGGSSGRARGDFFSIQIPPFSKKNEACSQPCIWRSHSFEEDQPAPCPRFCHAAAASTFDGYSTRFYVFGGYDGRKRLNDLWEVKVGSKASHVPPSTLIGDFSAFVDSDVLSDVRFLVEDRVVHAHKLVVCARAPVFRAMFLGGEYMESRANKEIELPGLRHHIFLMLLEYLYTDSATVSTENAMELFQAADQFGVERLKRICEDKMLASINPKNAASLFLTADVHNATQLRRHCLYYILANFTEVTKSEAFQAMGRENVELVFEILSAR